MSPFFTALHLISVSPFFSDILQRGSLAFYFLLCSSENLSVPPGGVVTSSQNVENLVHGRASFGSEKYLELSLRVWPETKATGG